MSGRARGSSGPAQRQRGSKPAKSGPYDNSRRGSGNNSNNNGSGNGNNSNSGSGNSGSGKGSGSKRGAGRGQQQQQQQQQHQQQQQRKGQQNEFHVSVKGFQPGSNREQLLDYLVGRVPFNFTRSYIKGDLLHIYIDSQRDAQTLCKQGNLIFHGQKLSLRLTSTPQDQQHQQQSGSGNSGRGNADGDINMNGSMPFVEVIGDFITRSYNAEIRFLCMARLGSQVMRINLNNSKNVRTLCGIIEKRCPDLQTLDFSENGIRSLEGFKALSQMLPHLANLSFHNNEIASLDELEHLRGIKARELIFVGNPIANDPNYMNKITSVFPMARRLDDKHIRPMIDFGVSFEKDHPMPQALGPFSTDAIRATAIAFVQQFFQHFDNMRPGLWDVYSDKSCFSLSVVGLDREARQQQKRQQRQRGQSDQQQQQRDRNAPPYKRDSRNMMHLGDDDRRLDLMRIGRVDIQTAFKAFPLTRHEPDMVVEALQLPANVAPVPLMQITCHGRFLEDGTHQRAFDRVLLVTLQSQNAKWPLLVVNDMLTVREYEARMSSSLTAQPTTLMASPLMVPIADAVSVTAPLVYMNPMGAVPMMEPLAAATATTLGQMPAGLTADQQQRLQQVFTGTRLTVEGAHQLLVQAYWDINVAAEKYRLLLTRNEIPAHFLRPA